MLKDIQIKQAAQISMLIGIVLVLMTLTFMKFFFFNPFLGGFNILGVFQFVSIIGWIALVLVPPVILNLRRTFTKNMSLILLIATFIWPAAVVLIRITLLIEVGNPYLTYLVQYPLFLFSDIVVPVIYFVIWKRLKADEGSNSAGNLAFAASRTAPKQDAPLGTPPRR
jgi:hypothetical protein